ncbi:soluble NSF attachment protein [Diplogelasinospora grovesii]|uniref:Soluble NSF attachment protein n=1 Tax=Diplogelasinospora grovesii TaxID=303347 RepID=A0AAN6NI47_9PEZI|nr:soluble NSF attachment protein [Diplogelasinospora grovesii]
MAGDPRALMQQADKAYSKAGSGGGFSSFFGGGNSEEKLENAAELYVQAANAFRMQKMNKEAGEAFEKAATIHADKLRDGRDEAANVRVEAFKVYKAAGEYDHASRCVDFSIKHWCSKGNFRRAAQWKEKEAEMWQEPNEGNNPKRALECSDTAAQWYESDGATALANKMWLKVAEYAALNNDFYRAIEIYEKVADSSLGNNLMMYSVKDYYFKALICQLATKDLVATHRNLERYQQKDPGFANTRECMLMTDLVAGVEAGDSDAFTDKLHAFNQMSKLDNWKVAMFLKIKQNIEEADNEFS